MPACPAHRRPWPRALVLLGCLALSARAADPLPPRAAIDLSAPANKEIADQFVAVDAEVARLRQANLPARADDLAARLATLRGLAAGKAPPRGAHDGAELHVVGVYAGALPGGRQRGFREHPQGEVVVDVKITDRPLVLALSAYEPVKWQLNLAPGARVERVILAGYHAQALAETPAGTAVDDLTHEAARSPDYFYAYNRESADFARAEQILASKTGLPISTFHGQNAFKGVPFALDPGLPDVQRQRVLADLEPTFREATAFDRARRRAVLRDVRFTAVHWEPDPRFAQMRIGRNRAMLAQFTPAGPIDGTNKAPPVPGNHLVVDPRNGTWYAAGRGHNGILRFDPAANEVVELPVDPALPELSWPCGLAFDTKRNRVVLASLGGVGHLYAYDLAAGKWALLGDMDDVDLHCLTYSAADDCFYGLTGRRDGAGNESAVIHVYDADGKLTRKVEPFRRLPLSRRAMHESPPQVIAVGGELILLLAPGVDGNGRPIPESSRAFRVDPKTGQVIGSEVLSVQPPHGRPANEAELAERWRALRDATNAPAVDKAIADFAAAGDAAVPFARAQLPQVKPADPARVADLVGQLRHDAWKVRETATGQLKALAPASEPQLRAALDAATDNETRTRLQSVLHHSRLAASLPPAELDALIDDANLRLRLRAVRALGRIGTPAAVDALHVIASDPAAPLEAAQARLALRQI